MSSSAKAAHDGLGQHHLPHVCDWAPGSGGVGGLGSGRRHAPLGAIGDNMSPRRLLFALR